MLPDLDDISLKLNGAKFFPKLDATGYLPTLALLILEDIVSKDYLLV